MKNIYTIIFCFFFFSLQAQDYYYNGSEKIKIYESNKSFISFDKTTQTFAKGFKNVETFSTKGFTILEDRKADFSARDFKKEKLNQTRPGLLLNSESDFKMFPTKTIRVKLKPNTSKEDIAKLFGKSDILEIEEKYGILRISINDIHKALEIANKIYESGLAEFSIPDFYIPMVLNQVNDPLFPQQFQMNNTGQVVDGIAGVNDIDCNALEAWNITLGDNITVAVLDQGLENHEDFGNRLIGGFTPATNGNGTPLVNNATHGMNCAGVIGASDNNLGIRGVAPNVNLLSVNIFADGTTPGDIADGIQWAINNDADVLSNSWGYINVPCGFTNVDIDNAIQNAVTNGRNGNGTVIIFSSGNTGGCVNYPASNPNVISVGAIDNRGNLYNYSSRGPELDLVAPSGETNYLGNIRTLDRMGNAGRNANHYENNFGGTSAACPVVSGVAALVLSINPNLTQQEVRNILTNTATDMGANGFDNNFGFGRINALKAVEETLGAGNLSLTGIDLSCTTNENLTFTLSGLSNPNITVNWVKSSNLQLISSSNNSITVSPTSLSGSAYVRATVLGTSIFKSFWLGPPIVNLSTDIPFTNAVRVNLNGGSSYANAQQGITNITWDKLSGNGVLTNTAYFTIGQYPTTWVIYGKATAVNQCGSRYKTFNIGWTAPDNQDPNKLGWLSTNSVSPKFSVFLNPVVNELQINFGDLFENNKRIFVVISDITGKIIFESNFSDQFGSLDTSDFPTGVYILKASNGIEFKTEKLFVK